jgi:hypothetical protein
VAADEISRIQDQLQRAREDHDWRDAQLVEAAERTEVKNVIIAARAAAGRWDRSIHRRPTCNAYSMVRVRPRGREVHGARTVRRRGSRRTCASSRGDPDEGEGASDSRLVPTPLGVGR